jgi:hypothetical protein
MVRAGPAIRLSLLLLVLALTVVFFRIVTRQN